MIVRKHRRGRLPAVAVAIGAAVLNGGAARAQGYSIRPFHVASDMSGVGIVDGARAPEPGSVDLGLSTDLFAGQETFNGAQNTSASIGGRWVVDPSITVGLGDRFAGYVRVPFVAYERAVYSSPGIGTVGALSLTIGFLIPVLRNPFNDARVGIRAELTPPVGNSDAFRGDNGFSGAVLATYGGPIGPTNLVVSGGAVIAPSLTGVGGLAGSAVVGEAGLRIPLVGWLGATVSAGAQVQIFSPNDSWLLACAGVDASFGTTALRFLGGVQTGFYTDLSAPWFGAAIVHDFDLRIGGSGDPRPSGP